MLEYESIEPRMLAYDRPSPKLLNFLSKYFNLNHYVEQNNNYVVFNDYFQSDKNKSSNSIIKIKNKENSFTTPNKPNINNSNQYEEEIFSNFKKIDLNSKSPIINKNRRTSSTFLDSGNILSFDNNTESEKNKNINTSKVSDHLDIKENNKIKNSNINKNPPWATTDDSIKFSSTSSNYGAYYAIKK